MKIKKMTLALRCAVYTSAAITICSIVFVSAYILFMGLANISPGLFDLNYTSDNVSLFPALINTIIVIITALSISIPIGIFSAAYLTEYALKSNKFVKVIRIAAETLTGIPSIVYGLFGMLLFVIHLKMGYSIIAGGLTLAIMTLPVIMRTAEEALIAVPDLYREGSFGLGAGKLRTMFQIILPSAFNGIFAGVILSLGRIFGETAALIFTAGTAVNVAQSINSSGRTLAVHLYCISSEGFHTKEAFATSAVLFIIVVFINSFSYYIAGKIGKR
ncbi:MAG: phosphate ABC transporter permease PstA [Chitinispirillales bacterium]|jgi:phosphate transport system permease protein|nr:phosphate ABC transporter permease PstA [Chitinispirillales bacterium]